MIWCAKAIRSAEWAALVLIWLGAGNVMLALSAKECTMTSADELAGVLLSLMLYVLALGLLCRGLLRQLDLWLALPLLSLGLLQGALCRGRGAGASSLQAFAGRHL
jgi:hypothetical protein